MTLLMTLLMTSVFSRFSIVFSRFSIVLSRFSIVSLSFSLVLSRSLSLVLSLVLSRSLSSLWQPEGITVNEAVCETKANAQAVNPD